MLELSIAEQSIHAITNLLTVALGLSLLVCLWFVGRMLCERLPLSDRADRTFKGLFACLTSLQLVAWHLYVYRESHNVIELGYVVAAMAIGACVWRVSIDWRGLQQPRLARWLPVAFASLTAVQLTGFALVTQRFAQFNPNTAATLMASPGELVLSAKACATTDRGTRLELYERNISPEEFELFLSSARRSIDAVTERAMRRDEAKLSSNCHGWVFTGGEYIVRGRDVQTILDENGYIEVATPVLNDVVIYRSGAGEIIHTGVVRGFLDGDSVLVEGKWGAEGTYLHLATEQPYSQNISYWHTDRGSHLLTTAPAGSSLN